MLLLVVVRRRRWLRTCVDLAAEAEDILADASADNGAVLFIVIDDLVFAPLNELARGFAPGSG